MIGAATAVPVGAVIRAGQRAGVRNILCIVIMPWVARAWLCSAARSPSCRRPQGPDGAAGGDRRGAARRSREARGPKAGRALVRPDAGAAAFGQPRAIRVADRGHHPERGARAALPGAHGQTETTIDRSQFDNRPAFSVADVLRESPGISVKQGNGPRDIGISIRGSNARNGFGIRNLVIFDDGFPVTQPDGLSRSDLIDPKAYAAIDVIRGPSSALYGNYATGGALNFRTRPGRTIDGVEYAEGGSFGYLNNYLAAGKKVGNFEYSLFASDARRRIYRQ